MGIVGLYFYDNEDIIKMESITYLNFFVILYLKNSCPANGVVF